MDDPRELPPRLRWLGRLLRRLPVAFRGKGRLARRLLAPLPEGPFVIRFGDQALTVPSLREPIALHLLMDGVYEAGVAELMRRTLGPGGTFVDVGANVGALTTVAAGLVGPTGRVLAIEPSPRLVGLLRRNLRGHPQVRVVECAAVAAASRLTFYEAPDHHFGMGSLAPQFGAAPSTVEGRALDDLVADLPRVDLLKVDVEGYESQVFEGARRLFAGPAPPLVVFEDLRWAETRAGFPAGHAQMRLTELGYDLWRLDDYLAGRPPLAGPHPGADDMLVARARRADPGPPSRARAALP